MEYLDEVVLWPSHRRLAKRAWSLSHRPSIALSSTSTDLRLNSMLQVVWTCHVVWLNEELLMS